VHDLAKVQIVGARESGPYPWCLDVAVGIDPPVLEVFPNPTILQVETRKVTKGSNP
jgi:hypothetical protein